MKGARVLSHIQVNRNITNPKPFADISCLSQFIDEKEVLFMAGSIFKKYSATPSDSIHMWIIELELCNNAAYELNPVSEKERDIVADQNLPYSLRAVLLRMNSFGKAKKYYVIIDCLMKDQ